MGSAQPTTEHVVLRADFNDGARAQVNVHRAQAKNTRNLIFRGCWMPDTEHGASHRLSVTTFPFAALRGCGGQNEDKVGYFCGFRTA